MPPEFVETWFIETADSQIEEVKFNGGDLTLIIQDHRQEIRSFVFHEVLCFRWDISTKELGIPPRGDRAYRVKSSKWQQASTCAEKIDNFAHYKLCFNFDDRDLDVICRINGTCVICALASKPHE